MTKKVKISLLLLVWGIALLQIVINMQERRGRVREELPMEQIREETTGDMEKR